MITSRKIVSSQRIFLWIGIWVGFLVSQSQWLHAQSAIIGLDNLLSNYVYLIQGKRIALITNHTGVNRYGQRNIDLLMRIPSVKLVKIFAPEHGLQGTVAAGLKVKDSTDPRTGLPVISLYDRNSYAPPPQSLKDVDLLIYDIQDVGTRTYTYIWTMAKAMETAGRYNIPFMVLDRPPVLPILRSDGPLANPQLGSLLTLYPIPRVYGLTAGELARYLNATFKMNCVLIIIPMLHYKRTMDFTQVQTKWIPPSPNIPDLKSARAFGATGTLGELGIFHIGIGTNHPFQIVANPTLPSQTLANELKQYNLPGISFEPFRTLSPLGTLYGGQIIQGIYLNIHDPIQFQPATTELALLHVLCKIEPRLKSIIIERSSRFDRAVGTSEIRKMLLQGKPWKDIVSFVSLQAGAFTQSTARWRIYGP